MGRAVFLPCCLAWGQTLHPCLPLNSYTLTGKSRSVSYGVTALFSWLLVCTRCCLCPPRVCFPTPVQVLVGSMVGLMAICSKRAYAIPRSAAPRAPIPASGHWVWVWWCILLQETLKHSKHICLSLCGVSWCTQGFVWALWSSLVGTGFDSIHDFSLPPSCWGFFFVPGHWVSFFGGILLSPVDGCLATSCNFGVLTEEDECTSFYSTILQPRTSLKWI